MLERKRLVAGNWKMNGLRADGLALTRDIAALARQPHRCELLVCPPATLLIAVGEVLAGGDVVLGGQDCHPEPKGAFTGDISAEMLKDAGCSHAIVGHSERRHACGETDDDVRAKALAAWRAGLVAIVCTRRSAPASRRIPGSSTAARSTQKMPPKSWHWMRLMAHWSAVPASRPRISGRSPKLVDDRLAAEMPQAGRMAGHRPGKSLHKATTPKSPRRP